MDEYIEDIDAFFAKPDDVVSIGKDVMEQIAKEDMESIIDMDQIRRMQDWSYLAGKIVGAEGE